MIPEPDIDNKALHYLATMQRGHDFGGLPRLQPLSNKTANKTEIPADSDAIKPEPAQSEMKRQCLDTLRNLYCGFQVMAATIDKIQDNRLIELLAAHVQAMQQNIQAHWGGESLGQPAIAQFIDQQAKLSYEEMTAEQKNREEKIDKGFFLLARLHHLRIECQGYQGISIMQERVNAYFKPADIPAPALHSGQPAQNNKVIELSGFEFHQGTLIKYRYGDVHNDLHREILQDNFDRGRVFITNLRAKDATHFKNAANMVGIDVSIAEAAFDVRGEKLIGYCGCYAAPELETDESLSEKFHRAIIYHLAIAEAESAPQYAIIVSPVAGVSSDRPDVPSIA